MRLVRVQTKRKDGRFTLIGVFRSETGRRLRKVLAKDLTKAQVKEYMQAAERSDALR